MFFYVNDFVIYSLSILACVALVITIVSAVCLISQYSTNVWGFGFDICKVFAIAENLFNFPVLFDDIIFISALFYALIYRKSYSFFALFFLSLHTGIALLFRVSFRLL